MRRFFLTALLFTIAGISVATEHSPLLPRPQKAEYGSGRLLVRDLGICFGSPASSEDRFSAEELSRLIKERSGAEVPILESCGQKPVIILTRTGQVDALPAPDERPGPESRESYHLKVTPSGVEIRGKSSAAVFYGVETLHQLLEGEGARVSLPEVEIEDWPSLAYRGVMVDVGSEGAMSTPEEVKRQIDFMALWKVNQYYFYSEANIELHGYPLLNPEARFTQDQVRQFIAYGRDRHIDVIPCLELFGHLHDVFRIEKYSDLSDFPHGGEFNPGNPKIKAVLSDWTDQYVQLFPSPFVNIGFDETWEIDKAAKQEGIAATPAKLFIEQLNTVANGFEQSGKRVMAWGDIMVKFPDIVSQLPPGIIAGAWYYEATPDPEYKHWLVPLVEKGVPHFVVTGVNNWSRLTPDFDTAFENIDTFLAAGRKSRALGLINTLWTDSQQNLLRQCWPGIAYGAVAPWQSAPVDRAQFFSDYARLVYGSTTAADVATALQDLTQAESALQKAMDAGTDEAMWADPFSPALLKRASEHREQLRQVRLLAEDAEEHLYRALAAGADPTVLETLLLGGRMLDYAGMRYIFAVEIADRWEHQRQVKEAPKSLWEAFGPSIFAGGHSRTSDLMDGITELRAIYRTNWLAEYTPYRLRKALGRWDAEYEYWRALEARFQAFAGEYKAGEPLPPLASIVASRSR
jgi:hexosaminidase